MTITERVPHRSKPCPIEYSERISILIPHVYPDSIKNVSKNWDIFIEFSHKYVFISRVLNDVSDAENSEMLQNTTPGDVLRFQPQKIFIGNFCLIFVVLIPCEMSAHQVSILGAFRTISCSLKNFLYTSGRASCILVEFICISSCIGCFAVDEYCFMIIIED